MMALPPSERGGVHWRKIEVPETFVGSGFPGASGTSTEVAKNEFLLVHCYHKHNDDRHYNVLI